jgi:hypothetical protein
MVFLPKIHWDQRIFVSKAIAMRLQNFLKSKPRNGSEQVIIKLYSKQHY